VHFSVLCGDLAKTTLGAAHSIWCPDSRFFGTGLPGQMFSRD